MKRSFEKTEFSSQKKAKLTHIFQPVSRQPNRLPLLWRAIQSIENRLPKLIDDSTKKNFTHSETGPFESIDASFKHSEAGSVKKV